MCGDDITTTVVHESHILAIYPCKLGVFLQELSHQRRGHAVVRLAGDVLGAHLPTLIVKGEEVHVIVEERRGNIVRVQEEMVGSHDLVGVAEAASRRRNKAPVLDRRERAAGVRHFVIEGLAGYQICLTGLHYFQNGNVVGEIVQQLCANGKLTHMTPTTPAASTFVFDPAVASTVVSPPLPTSISTSVVVISVPAFLLTTTCR